MRFTHLMTLCLGVMAYGATASVGQADDDYEDYLEERQEAREEYLEELQERREELRDRFEDRWEDRDNHLRGYVRPYGSYFSRPYQSTPYQGYGFSQPYSDYYRSQPRNRYGYNPRSYVRPYSYSPNYNYRPYGTGYRSYRNGGWSLSVPGVRLDFDD